MVLFVCGVAVSLGIALYGTRLLRGPVPFWTEVVMSVLSLTALFAAFGGALSAYGAEYSAFLSFGLLAVALLIAAARVEDLIVCMRTNLRYENMENLLILSTAAAEVFFLHHGLVNGFGRRPEDFLYVIALSGLLAVAGMGCEIKRKSADPFRLRAALFVSHLGFSAVLFCPELLFGPSAGGTTLDVMSFVAGTFCVTSLMLLAKLGVVLETGKSSGATAEE